MQRLDRLLSEAGVASRKELKAIIRAGRVSVNGVCIIDESRKFDENSVRVFIDGYEVSLYHKVVISLNKPTGYLTAADDPHQKTVMELIPEEYRRLKVMPVGRLDKETEGLLLFTNDGELAHQILSPRYEIWKEYYAEHKGQASADDVDLFLKGIDLEDGTRCLPAVLVPLGEGKSLVRVREGKYHQVRRMLASRGMPVTYLKRIREGTVELGDLQPGECRLEDIVSVTQLTENIL